MGHYFKTRLKWLTLGQDAKKTLTLGQNAQAKTCFGLE